MKKFLAIALAAVMCLSLAACGESSSSSTAAASTKSEAPAASTETKSEAAPAATEAPAAATEEKSEAAPAASGETIKIGVLMPLSGATASSGNYQLEGMQIAADYVNEHGGIQSMGGAQIELVVSDTAGDIETGTTEAERLITVENVSALCGPFNSTVGAATAPIAIQYGVPYVITNAIADNIMQNGANKYVYRVNFGAADMSPFRSLVLDYLGSLTPEGKLSKIAIVYDASDWGQSEYDTYSAKAEELGIEVVYNEALALDVSDLSSVVNKIKSSGAQVVFGGISLNTATLLAKTMNEYQCDVQLCGSGTGFSDPSFLASVGPEIANHIMSTTAFNPMYGTREGEPTALYEKYLETHDSMPEETINGFCGMATILEAIEAAGSSERDAIADALYDMDLDDTSFPLWFTMFDGINFNTEGDDLGRYNQNAEVGATAGQILMQVIDGKWQLVWPTERATADIVVNF